MQEACSNESLGFETERLGDGLGVEIPVPCENPGLP
ncbi:uncharacterized protein METZ01_LOCUS189579 [marine metagenome]|uniref:Uncharacterized protein n=1 Tax=marine metagenome TaxID=408172 RepID=A0A382DEN8_9ZZZZ